MAKWLLRKTLSAPGLLRVVRKSFDEIEDPMSGRRFSLSECLMSGLAVFGLKYPSLLQFDRDARTDETVRANLSSLYAIERAPCDTALRERLDEVDPQALRGVFKRVFAQLQRGKGLEGFTCLDGHYLLSVDGTGYFCSSSVHCKHCCEKHHKDGRVTYSHQMLGAVVVHPEQREVFPLAPEPIVKGDGATKNDCERNAAKRLLADVRREHPHLRLIVVEDGLASNGPHIKLLKALDMRFIVGAKPADHKALFEWVASTERMHSGAVKYVEHTDAQGSHHRFRYLNGVPLNDTHFDLEVNFLEYWETRPTGKVQHFSWVTDLPIDDANVMALMRAARARWRIENETFNTLKSQGYCFEHNFGHGKKHLSTVFAYLMMLAFLIDQVQQRCCTLFQAAQAKAGRARYFWERVRVLCLGSELTGWEMLYRALAFGYRSEIIIHDTS
jgi:hypothetical protein